MGHRHLRECAVGWQPTAGRHPFEILAASAIVVAAAIALLLWPGPAGAVDHPDTVDLSTIDPVPVRMWGVSGQDPASTQTPSLDVLVWDFAQSGDRVFVAGAFLEVREDDDSDPIPQPYVAAFDVDTGDWVSSWTPQLDRAAYALEVLASGSVLVGGEFETVNGQPRRGLVAIDPITGQIDQTFEAEVDRPYSDRRAMVRVLDVEGSLVYLAGNFSHVDGPAGSRVRVAKAARLTDQTGTVDQDWLPQVTGAGVWGLDADPVRGEVHLTGFFTSIDGQPDTGHFQTVDDTIGAPVTTKLDVPRNYPASQPEFYDVAVGRDLLFAIGEQHIVQVLDADDHRMVGFHHTGADNDGFEWTSSFAGGAFQVGERIGEVVYAGCHCTYSERDGFVNHYSSFTGRRTPQRLVMAYDAATGRLVEDFSLDINSPQDGVWAIGSDSNGCLYIGGDLHVGGVDSGLARWVGGFAKHCGQGPRIDGIVVDSESEWRYQDGGEPPAGWQEAGFDDTSWPSGQAELGFGDGDENTDLTPGSVTYYARTRFEFDQAPPSALRLQLKADDGAVVYLNGTEILRDNLPAGTITSSTAALTWRGGVDEDFLDHVVPADALVAGENVLAVEVHNVWSGNGDLGFDLRLSSEELAEPPLGPLVELGAEWEHTDSSAGAAPAAWPFGLGVPAGTAPGQFGFGDGDETTTLVGGQETYYFAHSFEVDDPTDYPDLVLSLLADDGAVAHLNGVEVVRSNMPDGPIAWNTRPTDWVSGDDERLVDHLVSGDGLVAGTNVITVEVHNYWPGNADLSFDLALLRAP